MYDLFVKAPEALSIFESFLIKQVKSKGMEHISNKELENSPKEMIDTLIAMR